MMSKFWEHWRKMLVNHVSKIYRSFDSIYNIIVLIRNACLWMYSARSIAYCVQWHTSDVSFICELLQWTTSLWWLNEVLHILKILLGIPTSSRSSSSFCSLLQYFLSLLLMVTYFTSNHFYLCATICGMKWSSLLRTLTVFIFGM